MIRVAQRGKHEFALAEEGFNPKDPHLTVMIFNERTNETTGPFPWQSLLARGYWNPPAESASMPKSKSGD
jgi:hypothetical protein